MERRPLGRRANLRVGGWGHWPGSPNTLCKELQDRCGWREQGGVLPGVMGCKGRAAERGHSSCAHLCEPGCGVAVQICWTRAAVWRPRGAPALPPPRCAVGDGAALSPRVITRGGQQLTKPSGLRIRGSKSRANAVMKTLKL